MKLDKTIFGVDPQEFPDEQILEEMDMKSLGVQARQLTVVSVETLAADRLRKAIVGGISADIEKADKALSNAHGKWLGVHGPTYPTSRQRDVAVGAYPNAVRRQMEMVVDVARSPMSLVQTHAARDLMGNAFYNGTAEQQERAIERFTKAYASTFRIAAAQRGGDTGVEETLNRRVDQQVNTIRTHWKYIRKQSEVGVATPNLA